MIFSTPIPFTEAIQKLRERQIIPSSANTADWAQIDVDLRERAFFSSRVESARVLQSMRDYLEGYLVEDRAIESHGGLRFQGRSEFVANMRELAIQDGLGKVDPETGKITPEIRENDLTDIRSLARLQLIFDTQVEAAQEYGYWQQGQDPDILRAFPAQRFIRVRPVMEPRLYHSEHEGEVRSKDDLAFWLGMNQDFNVPWGPWGFGSGMGVEDVGRSEAIELGIIGPDDVVRPVYKMFNEQLKAGVKDMDKGIAAALERATGGMLAGGKIQARVMPRNTHLDPEMVKERIASLARPDAVDLAATTRFPEVLPDGSLVGLNDIKDALRAAASVFPPSLTGALRKLAVEIKPMSAAGTYQNGTIRLSEKLLSNPAEMRLTLLHELTHAVMDDSPPSAEARRKIAEHFNVRTRGETLVTRGKNRYFRDKWRLLEAGLEDGGELASYYIEMIGLPPADLVKYLADANHRETFEIVLSALGIKIHTP